MIRQSAPERTMDFGIANRRVIDGLQLKVIMVLAVSLTGLAAGLIASAGDLRLSGLLVAGMAGIAVALLPRALLWITLIGGIVVAGAVKLYYPPLQGVRWLLPVVAWLLAAHAAMHLVRLRVHQPFARRQPVPAFIWWATAFVVSMLISGLLYWPGTETFLRGAKGYFQMWGLLFALAFYPWPPHILRRLPMFVVAVALLQVPFAIQQYLVLVPQREGLGEGVVAVDIVAGTFGGEKLGGGANAVLSTFLMITFIGLLSAWRQKVLPLAYALILGLPLFIPVTLNVSKISLVYAFVAFVVLFGRDIIHKPTRFLVTGTLFAGLIAVLATAYTALAPTELGGWKDLVEYTYEENVAEDYTNTGALTRGGSLNYWLETRLTQPVSATLFGVGPGATRSDEEVDGENPVGGPVDADLKVGRLAVTAILWEGGLVALLIVFGMFASAFLAAGRLAGQTQDAFRRAMYQGIQAGVAVLFVSLWHKHFFVFHVGYQTMFALVFGYLAYAVRNEPLPVEPNAGTPRTGSVRSK